MRIGSMERKHINFEIKSLNEETGEIEGYGSTFGGEPDSHGDVIVKGAFAKSLTERPVRMLSNHNWDNVVGKWDEIVEDEHGLRIKGRFANTPKGQEIRELVKMGAIDSFSIGYITKDFEVNSHGVYLLKEVDLYEVSIVTVPSNKNATVTSIKSLEIRDVETLLRDAAGFSRQEAKALLAGGYKALCNLRDVESKEADVSKEQAEIISALKSIFSN